MNKDKMELKEVKRLKKFIKEKKRENWEITYNRNDDLLKDLETVLQELEKLQKRCKELIEEKQELTSALLDSIPKEKIEDKITYWNKRLNDDERLDWILRDKCIINVLQELLEDK